MKKSRILALLLALAMLASMAACGAKNEAPAAPSAPAEGNSNAAAPAVPAGDAHYAVDADTVVVCTADETPSVTARKHNAVAGSYINNLTYETLIALDIDLVPQPCLAESYEYEEQADGSMLWTFHLRQGVKFHNGAELKSEDVVASFAEAKESPDVATYSKGYDNVTAVDDYTVTMTTAGPSAALLYDMAHHGNAIVPAELLKNGHDFNVEPIGTGPYKLTEWKISESLAFDAHEDYWKGAPAIKHVLWKIIPEGSARTIALQAHEVDYVIELDSNDMNLVEEDNSLSLMVIDSVSHNWLSINN